MEKYKRRPTPLLRQLWSSSQFQLIASVLILSLLGSFFAYQRFIKFSKSVEPEVIVVSQNDSYSEETLSQNNNQERGLASADEKIESVDIQATQIIEPIEEKPKLAVFFVEGPVDLFGLGHKLKWAYQGKVFLYHRSLNR